MIDHKKVIESMNVTFDDNKLPSIQIKDDTETLKFENLILEDSDNEEPDVAEDRQVNNVNNGDTNLAVEMMVETQRNTGYEMGSSSHQSSSSGGANKGSTSRTQQNNNNAESSRMNLPRERSGVEIIHGS